MSRRVGSRTLAVGSLAAGVAAGLAAVVSALGGQTTVISQAKAADATVTYHPVAFGGGSVGVQKRPGGMTCFTVLKGSSAVARACAGAIYADQIQYASSRYAVGGLYGADVRAVIVKLTRKGTTWATLKDGAFYAAVPKGHNVRAVIKVVRGGSRTTFTVTGSR
ncbi:MAG TPA: hypothetical protein VI408_09500 [Gaiellaceae bacterium]